MSYLKINDKEVEIVEIEDFINETPIEKIEMKIQTGPISEHDQNGLQVDHIILLAERIINKFNKMFPCHEDSIVLMKLQEAQLWLYKRQIDRVGRNVEGKSEV